MVFTTEDLESIFAGIEKDSKEEEELKNVIQLIEIEEKKGDPSLIQEAYDLGCQLYPNVIVLWLSYLSWLNTSLKIPSVAVKVYERAMEHHDTNSVLMQMALTGFEQANEPPERIDEVWNMAKRSIGDADSGRSLYTTYIFLLKRRVVQSGSADFSAVQDAFEDGYNFLKDSFDHWDIRFKYRLMYAYFLYSVAKNVNRAREILTDVLASGGSTSPRVVIEAVTYERHFGHDITRCRRMLYQTVNSVVDEAHVLFEYFIQFEREEGTLNELNKALEKVNNQVKRLHERGEHIKKKRVHPVPQKKKKLENGSTVAQKSPAKRKIVEEEPAVPAKKPETVRDKDGFVMPTLPVNRPMKKAKTEPQPIEEMEVDSELEANVEKSEVVTEANGESSDQPVSEEVKERAKNNKDRTVFVSNLVYDVSKEQLAALFDNIDTIRLAGAKGLINHKGYGYIDFKTVDDASRALLKDRTPLNGRPVFVSLNKKKEKSKDDPSVDKRKLFVSNVHFECTDQDVKDVFIEFGNVVRVLIAKKASGTPKGCAYVDFDTQEAGEKAVGATKLKLRGRPLNIVYNKPPKKQKENHSVKTARHKRIDPKGSAGIFTRKEEASSADTNGSNMSNDEFRRFL